MSEILVTALRVGFLALMWLFILWAANVIRTDLFGRQIAADSPELGLRATPTRAPKRRRNEPTKLALIEGRGSGTNVPLIDGLVIGRAHDAALTIDDDYSSTHHARLLRGDAGTWQVEDLRSTNGTYVNEVRITQPTKITPKDTIRIGRTHLRLEK